MGLRTRFFLAAAIAASSLFAPLSHAAFVTIDETGLDSVFSQASFGSSPIDIRIGATTTVVNPNLLNIDTDAKINSVFNLHVGGSTVVNFYFVDTVNACGGFNVNIVGCGEFPGQDFVVESIAAADTTVPTGGSISVGVQLLAHELGHNLGLDHFTGNFLMNPSINGFGNLSPLEVSEIFKSPLVHQDTAGYYIQINPVLIAAEIPEPSSLAMMLAGLLATGGFAKRRTAAA